jgi:hypothetical protein
MATLGEMYNQALMGAGATGKKVMPEALDRLASFDARDSLAEFTRGATDQSQRAFRSNLNRLKGSSVRAGRLNTGFFDEDAGELALDSQANLNNMISQQSMQALRMQQDNDARYLSAGQQQEQQYFDLLTGGLDREQAERNRRTQQRSSMWSSLASLGGTALGFIAGGPGGAALGGKLGGMLGGAKKIGNVVPGGNYG